MSFLKHLLKKVMVLLNRQSLGSYLSTVADLCSKVIVHVPGGTKITGSSLCLEENQQPLVNTYQVKYKGCRLHNQHVWKGSPGAICLLTWQLTCCSWRECSHNVICFNPLVWDRFNLLRLYKELRYAWQSRIEIEYYSVAYFEHITEFNALLR